MSPLARSYASRGASAVRPDASTARALPEPAALNLIANIAWRATDVSSPREVKPELLDQSRGVLSIAATGDPFVALRQKFDEFVEANPDRRDVAAVQLMERARTRAENMRDHLVLADDEGRMKYMLDGMGIIDHTLDNDASNKVQRYGMSFEDARFESMRTGTTSKQAYVNGLQELTHPGSMRNLDACVEKIATHVDEVYERAGVEAPGSVRAAQAQLRAGEYVDGPAGVEKGVDKDVDAGVEQDSVGHGHMSDLDRALAALNTNAYGSPASGPRHEAGPTV